MVETALGPSPIERLFPGPKRRALIEKLVEIAPSIPEAEEIGAYEIIGRGKKEARLVIFFSGHNGIATAANEDSTERARREACKTGAQMKLLGYVYPRTRIQFNDDMHKEFMQRHPPELTIIWKRDQASQGDNGVFII